MENGLNYVSSVPGRHLGYPGLVTALKVTQCLQFTEFLHNKDWGMTLQLKVTHSFHFGTPKNTYNLL